MISLDPKNAIKLKEVKLPKMFAHIKRICALAAMAAVLNITPVQKANADFEFFSEESLETILVIDPNGKLSKEILQKQTTGLSKPLKYKDLIKLKESDPESIEGFHLLQV